MAVYDIALLVVSLAILGAVVLPRVLADKPMSFPLIYVIGGWRCSHCRWACRRRTPWSRR
ncbi:hypothetical protein ACFQL4_27590 [Halosimplex aquaticum]